MAETHTTTVHGGIEVEVEHVDALANGGARFDIRSDGKRWRVDVQRSGEVEIVTTWKDGQLADLDEPEWLDDVVSRLQQRG
jgi:hypothetical protein